MATKDEIKISVKDLLETVAKYDYPIRYQDGSYGRGIGYGDLEKIVKKLSREEKTGKRRNATFGERVNASNAFNALDALTSL